MNAQIQDQPQTEQEVVSKASSDWFMKIGVVVLLLIVGMQMSILSDRETAARVAAPLTDATDPQ